MQEDDLDVFCGPFFLGRITHGPCRIGQGLLVCVVFSISS